MTRIDTGDIARFWLAGSQQGIGMANSLAQQEMEDRQFRQRQEEVAFGQSLSLERLAMDRQEEARQQSMHDLRVAAIKEADDQKKNTAKTIATLLRARLAGSRTRRSSVEASAMANQVPDLAAQRSGQRAKAKAAEMSVRPNPMQGQDAAAAAYSGSPRPKPTKINPDPFEYDATQLPLERDYERAITAAEAMGDVEALRFLGGSIDDDMKRQADMAQGQMIIDMVDNWQFVDPEDAPELRAQARLAAYLGKFDTVFKIMENNHAELGKMTPTQFRAALAGISGGALSDEELDAWSNYFATSRYSPYRKQIEDDARRAAVVARSAKMKAEAGNGSSGGAVEMDGPSRRALADSYGAMAAKIEGSSDSDEDALARAKTLREAERAILRGAPVDADGNIILASGERNGLRTEKMITQDGRPGERKSAIENKPSTPQSNDQRPTSTDRDGVPDLAKQRAEKPEAIVATFSKQRPNEASRMRELAAQGYSADEIERIIEDEFGLGE